MRAQINVKFFWGFDPYVNTSPPAGGIKSRNTGFAGAERENRLSIFYNTNVE